jgi:hypothetical protein
VRVFVYVSEVGGVVNDIAATLDEAEVDALIAEFCEGCNDDCVEYNECGDGTYHTAVFELEAQAGVT